VHPTRPRTSSPSTLRTTRDGWVALHVYSAMDRLVAYCGPAQPWTVILTKDLEQLRETTGFQLTLLDLDIPEELPVRRETS